MKTTTYLFLICFWGNLLIAQEASFRKETLDSNIQIGYGLAIGDVDGDQKLDILLADKKAFVWYRNGDWKRFIMAENLTEKDNVCITAKDINGDGQVEVAVGGQWNPGNTQDKAESGSVHYLIRPDDPTQKWEAVPLYHEPTIHRMHWVKTRNSYALLALPLHGIGNSKGEGAGVNLLYYPLPEDIRGPWNYKAINTEMHMTHNMDIYSLKGEEYPTIAGKEGVRHMYPEFDKMGGIMLNWTSFGEVRESASWIAGIQPMHGDTLAIYDEARRKKVLSTSLKQGHALAWGDFMGLGYQQIVVGWRSPNEQNEMGIKLFVPADEKWSRWEALWIDKNGIACEDLKVADLNGDGKAEIIAAGRSTHNLVIYWNESP
ncbi:MAG: VCBS repeat-containing protein [Bacteroidota bacterium]